MGRLISTVPAPDSSATEPLISYPSSTGAGSSRSSRFGNPNKNRPKTRTDRSPWEKKGARGSRH